MSFWYELAYIQHVIISIIKVLKQKKAGEKIHPLLVRPSSNYFKSGISLVNEGIPVTSIPVINK